MSNKTVKTLKRNDLQEIFNKNNMIIGFDTDKMSKDRDIKVKSKLVQGVGITDLPAIDENGVILKSYNSWASLIELCYRNAPVKGEVQPRFYGLCKEWRRYSTYKKWYDRNYRVGCVLDSFILMDNTYTISPETVCFAPIFITNLFLGHRPNTKKRHRKLPQGVYNTKNNGKYSALLSEDDVLTYLGHFKYAKNAHKAYLKARVVYVTKKATEAFNNGLITTIVRDSVIGLAEREK